MKMSKKCNSLPFIALGATCSNQKMSHGKISASCGIRQQLGSGMLITDVFLPSFVLV